MLPGIRFIFVTVILSASVLIFGLGAAALLRVSYEEFATLPSWRVAQPQFPPAPAEITPPTLAMLRIETPDTAKTDASGVGPDPIAASPDAAPKAHDTLSKQNMTAEAPPQPEVSAASAGKSADPAGEPDSVPADSPAPSVVAVASTPSIEKRDNGTTDAGSRNSEDAAPAVPADQTEATEAQPEKAEAVDITVADITASVPKSENKLSEPAITADAKGREVKLPTVKVRAAKLSKSVAKKAKRSGIYAMAQRRRAAARARAIARARAANLAQQQKLVAADPLAVLFGIQPQQPQVVQPTQQQ